MKTNTLRWVPAMALAVGCGFLLLSQRQRTAPLAAPLAELPKTLLGASGHDVPISPEEQRIAGMSSYLLRSYANSAEIQFSVYVGYYDSQSQGRTIHSPRNCLPGAGWEPLSHLVIPLPSARGVQYVNRYLVANGKVTALVYYWYQGRGRIQASEYAVKWDLLRDKAMHGRSEEALVRIVVPITGDNVASADSLAKTVGGRLVEELERHLPEFPGRTLSKTEEP